MGYAYTAIFTVMEVNLILIINQSTKERLVIGQFPTKTALGTATHSVKHVSGHIDDLYQETLNTYDVGVALAALQA